MIDLVCFFCFRLVRITTVSTSNSFDAYLTNYWPISNSLMNDVIGNADMVQGANTAFTADRFGNPNSALNLNGGYTQVPAGFYFGTPEFTISSWVYPRTVGNMARLIDFGNGAGFDNIVFTFSDQSAAKPYFQLFRGVSSVAVIDSNSLLANQAWQLLVATFDASQIHVYINGTLSGSCPVSNTLPPVLRTFNYIGKSNWPSDGFSYSDIDDLRFYNISLSQTQINELSGITTTTTTTTTTSELFTPFLTTFTKNVRSGWCLANFLKRLF